MNRYRAVLIFLFSAAILSGCAGVKWKVSAENNPVFPKMYYFNGCAVAPNIDKERGVIITAVDENWYGKILVENTKITKDKYGELELERRFFIVNEDGVARYAGKVKKARYDVFYQIFYMKCLAAAGKLPRKVKDSFLGYYGLSEK